MSMNALILSTLNSLPVPVEYMDYSGASTTYITFFFYNEQGALYADDEEIETAYGLQVDVWSKGDYTSLVDQTKSLLKQAGFIRNYAIDLFEEDTKIYHKSLRFNYVN